MLSPLSITLTLAVHECLSQLMYVKECSQCFPLCTLHCPVMQHEQQLKKMLLAAFTSHMSYRENWLVAKVRKMWKKKVSVTKYCLVKLDQIYQNLICMIFQPQFSLFLRFCAKRLPPKLSFYSTVEYWKDFSCFFPPCSTVQFQ